MDWLHLLLAIAGELGGTFCFKLASVSGKPVFYWGVALGYASALWMFGLSLKTIDVSIAYAVWSGIGIVVTTLLGFAYFHEPLDARKLLYIALILSGVVGLNLVSD
jgi:multidrug transporter EmrE-like cation transporter